MINRKIVDISIQSEIFFKHNKCDFISESFALNWYIFVALTHKIYWFHCNEDLKWMFFLNLLVEYLPSTVINVSSNSWVGSLPRTKIFFFCY